MKGFQSKDWDTFLLFMDLLWIFENAKQVKIPTVFPCFQI